MQISGPISVRPVTGNVHSGSLRYLIMGPTGAGKSTFIEALAGESHRLNISGDQLASVTQKVTAYELVNVCRHNLQVCIVDTPGFSDSKISEGEIVDMVTNEWKEDNFRHSILFFISINVTRIEGTKRRTIKMIDKLLGMNMNQGLIIVTTMWDQLGSESLRRRAESNYKQLKNEILKEYIDKGAQLTVFKNNQSSALQILDKDRNIGIIRVVFHSRPELFYLDLQERISTALQEKKSIEEQLADTTNNDILELIELLEKNHADNEDLLVKFIGQLRLYNQSTPGYEESYAHITAEIVALGDELENMEERARERALASGHQPQHQVPVLGNYRRHLQQELELYQQDLEKQCELEQQYDRELERQRLIRESKFTSRIQQKMRKVGSSITSKLKSTLGQST